MLRPSPNHGTQRLPNDDDDDDDKKIRETHTNGHAQKIRIVQVLTNNM